MKSTYLWYMPANDSWRGQCFPNGSLSWISFLPSPLLSQCLKWEDILAQIGERNIILIQNCGNPSQEDQAPSSFIHMSNWNDHSQCSLHLPSLGVFLMGILHIARAQLPAQSLAVQIHFDLSWLQLHLATYNTDQLPLPFLPHISPPCGDVFWGGILWWLALGV